jgi:hypothetical protein
MKMVEKTMKRRRRTTTAFLLLDITDHFSPSVIAPKRNCAGGEDRFLSCCIVLPLSVYAYTSQYTLLELQSHHIFSLSHHKVITVFALL